MVEVKESNKKKIIECMMKDTISPKTKKLARIRKLDYD